MFDANAMKQIVSAAVVNALADQGPALLTELVDKALNRQVNEYGGEPKYGEAKMTVLEMMSGRQIQLIIQEAVREYFEQHKGSIKEAVIAKMAGGEIGDSLVEAMTKAVNEHGFNIEFNFRRPD